MIKTKKRKRPGRVARIVVVPAKVRPLLVRIGRLADQEGISAYAVGGCVRDWFLKISTTVDLDIVVEGDGLAFARVLGCALGGSVTFHPQFGTATLHPAGFASLREAKPGAPGSPGGGVSPRAAEVSGAAGLPAGLHLSAAFRGHRGRTSRSPSGRFRIDIATCRKETYAKPAAYPTVRSGTLRDDLRRRDFTINAMAVAITPARFGALIDPFGGRRDLVARRLRILHPKSFVDDPSRILRAGRFVQRFDLALEPATRRRLQQAIAAGMLGLLNRGRIRKEFGRMTNEPNPLACLACVDRWLKT